MECENYFFVTTGHRSGAYQVVVGVIYDVPEDEAADTEGIGSYDDLEGIIILALEHAGIDASFPVTSADSPDIEALVRFSHALPKLESITVTISHRSGAWLPTVLKSTDTINRKEEGWG